VYFGRVHWVKWEPVLTTIRAKDERLKCNQLNQSLVDAL
jgi:hypothetical protein